MTNQFLWASVSSVMKWGINGLDIERLLRGLKENNLYKNKTFTTANGTWKKFRKLGYYLSVRDLVISGRKTHGCS